MAELPVLPLLHDDVDEVDGQGAAEEAGQRQKDEQLHVWQRFGSEETEVTRGERFQLTEANGCQGGNSFTM